MISKIYKDINFNYGKQQEVTKVKNTLEIGKNPPE